MSRPQRSLRSAGLLAAATMALVALLVPAAANAWTSPVVTSLCAPDADHYAFTVTLAQETNENFDWSFGSSGPWTTVAGHVGGNTLVVLRGTGDLWVRWTSDQGLMAHTTPNGTLCLAPAASATPSPTPSPTGSVAASASASASVPVQSEVVPATPRASPSGAVLGATGVPALTPPPTDSVAGSSPTGDSWRTMLLGMAALLVLGLVLAPSRRR